MLPSILPGRGFRSLARQSALLFHFESRDLSLRAISGQQGVFSRASVGTAFDPLGRVITVPSGQPRFTWIDGVPYLLLERAGTNLVLRSEDFGTGWTTSGTPTRVAAAHTASGVSLDLVGDDSTGVAAFYGQTILFTGDGEKAVSLHMKRGTSPPANGNAVLLRDTTASTNRLGATIAWAADGVPTVTMQAGTHLATIALRDGVYRFLFRTTSVTASGTNQVRVYGANTTVAETGDVYAGGVQVENSDVPSSYIKTEASAVTRAADGLAFDYLALPCPLTMYARFVERGTVLINSGRIAQISSGPEPRFTLVTRSSFQYGVTHGNGVSAQSVGLSTAPGLGDEVELCGTLSATGSVRLFQSINGDPETSSSESSAVPLAPAWADTKLVVNGPTNGLIALESLKIAAGVRSLDYMRSAF